MNIYEILKQWLKDNNFDGYKRKSFYGVSCRCSLNNNDLFFKCGWKDSPFNYKPYKEK